MFVRWLKREKINTSALTSTCATPVKTVKQETIIKKKKKRHLFTDIPDIHVRSSSIK